MAIETGSSSSHPVRMVMGTILIYTSIMSLEASARDMKLTDLKTGATARVVSVIPAEGAAALELERRLAELGFLPGEAVRVVARGLLARAPIAVRIGTGTFALRLFEAACIRVCPEQTPAV